MSYIVPKDKPTACRNCNFMDKITYDCKLMRMEDYPDFETQYANCPLIEVRPPAIVKTGRHFDSVDAYLKIGPKL